MKYYAQLYVYEINEICTFLEQILTKNLHFN